MRAFFVTGLLALSLAATPATAQLKNLFDKAKEAVGGSSSGGSSSGSGAASLLSNADITRD